MAVMDLGDTCEILGQLFERRLSFLHIGYRLLNLRVVIVKDLVERIPVIPAGLHSVDANLVPLIVGEFPARD